MRAQIKISKTIAILVIVIVVTFIILALVYAFYKGALPPLASFIAEKKEFKPI